MGCYKIGSECCNNCVHWDCHSERKFIGNPPKEVYTDSNSDKCFLTGQNTLSKNTCGMFKHIGGITRTFAAEQKHAENDYMSNMLDACDETSRIYLQSVVGELKAKAAQQAQAQREAQRAREQERREAQRARDARKMEILIKNGMDPNASSDEQFQFELMCRAASPDDADSLCDIGEACFTGTFGAKEDPEKGVKYFEKAARMGLAKAQYMLGCAYWTGKGVEESELRAFQWFKDAAGQGYAEAQYRLGMCYVRGFSAGGTKIVNVMEGLPWLKKAAENGHEKADEAIKEAVLRLVSKADDGAPSTMNDVGLVYYNGEYVAQDYVAARDWFSKAAWGGSESGMNNLGEMCRDGEGGDKSLSYALLWFVRASQKGKKRATENLEKLSAAEIREAFAENPVHTEMLLAFVGAAFFKDDATEEQKKEMKGLVEGASKGLSAAYLKLAKVFWSKQSMCVKNQALARVFLMIGIAKAHDGESCFLLGKFYFNGWVVEEDKKEAFKWYCKAAEQNNPDAQNMAGRCCQCGWGCDVDFEKAQMFFSKAAEQNDLAALNNLAVMYENGQGCQKDVKKARELFAKAVAGDFSRAAYHLGRFYENGIDGDRDVSEAVKLYSKAADDGDADALVALAEIYLKGNDDVEQDIEKAVELLEEAADNNERPSAKSLAKALLGECYENGWGVEKDEEKAGELYEEAAKDEKCALGCYNYGRFLEFGLGHVKWNLEKAVYYYRKAVVEEYVKAYCKMGDLHVVGRALKKDLNEAFKWYYKAAEQNDPYAQNMVAGFYKRGDGGVEKDYNAAFAWRMKAAEQGYAPAQTNVGECYVNGMGCEKDFAKALLWLEKAAEQGDVVATSDMGWCYAKGVGCDPDPVKAAYYYKKAAEQKNSTACNNLALMYEQGNGVEKGLKKAYDLLMIAVKRGNTRSCYHLGRFYENGLAVQADRAKAKEWYSKAAAKGDKDAKAALERLG